MDNTAPNQAQPIVEILLAEHVLTQQQYDEIKVRSASEGRKPDDILLSVQNIPEEKLVEAKAKLLGVPFITLAKAPFSPQALNLVPRSVAERFHVIPFLYDEKTNMLSVAMSNPEDLDALQFVRQKTGMNVKTFAASQADIVAAIATQYRQELVTEVGAAVKETEDFNKIRTIDSSQIAQLIKEAPIAKIVSTILEYAVTSRASDIHIEPQEDRIRVRYRIDG